MNKEQILELIRLQADVVKGYQQRGQIESLNYHLGKVIGMITIANLFGIDCKEFYWVYLID